MYKIFAKKIVCLQRNIFFSDYTERPYVKRTHVIFEGKRWSECWPRKNSRVWERELGSLPYLLE